MPHLRSRHVRPYFEKLCAFSPLVGVFGHRQTGKTTLVSAPSKNYVTFDSAKVLMRCNEDAESFIRSERSRRTTIDGCQLSPPLFPALKDWVRTHKTRGGAYVPLALRSEKGTLGIIVCEGDAPTLSQKRSADSFLRRYRGSKAVFLSNMARRPAQISPSTILLPTVCLL